MNETPWKAAVYGLLTSLEDRATKLSAMLEDPPPRSSRLPKCAEQAKREYATVQSMVATTRTALAEGDAWHAMYCVYLAGKAEGWGFFEALDGWAAHERDVKRRAEDERKAENARYEKTDAAALRAELEAAYDADAGLHTKASVREEVAARHGLTGEALKKRLQRAR